MLTIRQASLEDVPTLRSLIQEMAEFEKLPLSITEQILANDGFGSQTRFRVLIAEYDDEPAGYAFFFDSYSTFQGRGLFTLAKLSCLACLFPIRPDVADAGHDLSHLAIFVWIGRLPSVQAIYVAVEHAEGSRDQNGIVNLFVGGSFLACPFDIFRYDVLATFLNLAGDREQRFQLVGDFRGGVVPLDAIDQIVISAQVFGGGSAVRELAETAIILRRDVHCDHFAFGRRQGVRPAQKDLHELAQRLGAFRTDCHRTENAGRAFGYLNVCHEIVPF